MAIAQAVVLTSIILHIADQLYHNITKELGITYLMVYSPHNLPPLHVSIMAPLARGWISSLQVYLPDKTSKAEGYGFYTTLTL